MKKKITKTALALPVVQTWKNSTFRQVTFVVAAGIPEPDLLKLEKSWRKDPMIAQNYEVYVQQLCYYTDSAAKPLITAPSIPPSELRKLRKRIKAAIKDQKNNVVFTNYNLSVHVV
jgi:hypothetical protein